MKESIKIPTGYEFSHVDGNEIVLKRIRPKMWPYSEHETIDGFYVGAICDIIAYKNFDRKFTNRNVFRTKKQAEASISLAMLTQCLQCLNQEPIVWDGVTAFHCIHISIIPNKNQFLLDVNEFVIPQLLAFHDEAVAKEFLEVHREIIEKAAPLLCGVEIGGKDE